MGQKKKTDSQNNNAADAPITVVLKVDMHCTGCASKIIRTLRAFQGVDTVKPENDAGKITVTGKVDPAKVRDKLAEKLKKKVELVSPQPKKEKDKGNKDNNSNAKTDDRKPKDKEKEPPVTTAVFKLALHCQGCEDKITRTVLKTKGVHTLSIDKDKETITVNGTMDVEVLAANLMERLKRKVEVVPPKKDKEGGGDKEGGKKKNKGGGGGDNNKEKNEEQGGGGGLMEQGKMEYLPPPAFGFAYGPHGYTNVGGYTYAPVYSEHMHLHAPQMFSDENPNACSLM